MDNSRHRRIEGNETKCCSCKFYEPAEKPEKLHGWNDGYCTFGILEINSQKFKRDRVPIRHLSIACKDYVDYYDGATWAMLAGFEPMQTAIELKGEEE